ncbi:MAG: O-antigen ligase family protein, partial [Chloroflexota bacterium]|nr:O-antigen ligase family protein [Chloroflexota bacterium]
MLISIRQTASHLARFEIWSVAFFVAASMAWPRLLPAALGVGIIFWIIRCIAYHRLSIRTPIDGSAAVLFLTILVTLYVTALPEITNQQSLRLLMGMILFYAIVNWTSTEKDLRLLITGTAFTGLILALAAPFSVQWAVDKLSFLPNSLYERFTQIFSDVVHPNVLAGVLILILPITASWLLYTWREMNWLNRILFTLTNLLILVVIIFTQSRGAWIAVASMLLAALLLHWRRGWIGILLIIFLSIAAIYQFGITSILEGLASNPTIGDFNNRMDIWFRAIYMIQDFPFSGIGMGLYKVTADTLYPFSSTSAAGIPHAHNIFLQVGVDLGIPGLVSWLSILIAMVLAAWQTFQYGRQSHIHWITGLGSGLLLSQVGLVIHGLTDAVVWGMVRPAPIVWGFWGITAAAIILIHKR